jgi:hypothetical protein
LKVSSLTADGINSKIITIPSCFPSNGPSYRPDSEIPSDAEITQVIHNRCLSTTLRSLQRFLLFANYFNNIFQLILTELKALNFSTFFSQTKITIKFNLSFEPLIVQSKHKHKRRFTEML